MKQKIYFGPPGTGKSHLINKKLQNISATKIFRTTFHPEYTYSDFIGQILPTIEIDLQGNKNITYKFNKGIFTQAIEEAYKDLLAPTYLIIEEMSRGNVSSIFGDLFQLLDRETLGPDIGFSKYAIHNDFIIKDIITLSDKRLRIPPNLIILGTLNTSDQNVFAMDTAFKRRFDWQYVGIENNHSENNPNIKVVSEERIIDITWTEFYTAINKFITYSDFLDLGEDKQIGHFFMNFNQSNNDEINEMLKNKLLHYLWSDVHKISFKNGVSLFKENIQSYAYLYNSFTNNQQIFSDKFLNILKEIEE